MILWLFIQSFFLLSITESLTNSDSYYQVPSITFSNLKNKQTKSTLLQALTTTGILSITNINGSTNNDFSKTRNAALQGLCNCAATKKLVDTDNSESFTLMDGVTTRTTIATLTSNGIPLALNGNQIDTVCEEKLSEDMEKLRDYVHAVSREFVSALDEIISSKDSSNNALLETSHGKSYKTINDIVQDATHLEHFHVYSKQTIPSSIRKNIVLDTHTDAGLFLSFVPSMPCSENEDSSFKVSVDGTLKQARFSKSDDSVVIMLGVGAEYWLQNEDESFPKLVAAKHAVQMEYGSVRSWYGIMHLVPEKAIIDRSSSTTFAEMRSSMIIRHPQQIINTNDNKNKAVALGCGHSSDFNVVPTSFGRRLQTHVDASVCNNETKFYCWMSCIDVPNSDSAQDNVNNGEALYCADVTMLDQGIVAAVESCSDVRTGAPGGAMNTNCIGVWHTVDKDVPSQTLENVDYSVQASHDQENHMLYSMDQFNQYCYGGTSMYMNGFQWEGIYCIIYLFPSWVLNTHLKFVIACLGTVLIGVILEGVITARRMIVQSKRFTTKHKLFISMLIYGLQLTLGYFIMLVVMTYSGPLFISAIIGLMTGHLLFQILVPPTVHHGTEKNNKSVIIEGATPCCQNHVPEEDEMFDDDNKSQNDNQGSTQGLSDDLTEDHFNSCNCPAPQEENNQEKEYVFNEKEVQEPESCCGTMKEDKLDDKVEEDIEASSVESFLNCCGGGPK